MKLYVVLVYNLIFGPQVGNVGVSVAELARRA